MYVIYVAVVHSRDVTLVIKKLFKTGTEIIAVPRGNPFLYENRIFKFLSCSNIL